MCPTCMVAPAATRQLCALPGGREHPDRIRLTIRTYTPLAHHHRHRGRNVRGNDPVGPKPAMMTITGELDSTAARLVADRCSDYIACTGSVVIDLSAVTLIDSAGVRLLEQFRDLAQARLGRVWLIEPSPVVQRVLDVIGVERDTFSDVAYRPVGRSPSAPDTMSLLPPQAAVRADTAVGR